VLKGTVRDDEGKPLIGANVLLNPGERVSTTDGNGRFQIHHILGGKYRIEISFVGYKSHSDTLFIYSDLSIEYSLQQSLVSLQEVIVSSDYVENRKRDDAQNLEIVDDNYIRQNLSGSLMNSLERLPGISSIQIGSGQSKPVIRGLGFNRVLVIDNNLKHESQQWGADHGLEIDQYALDNVEIIKGPASMMYGSDAIGGVITLKNREMLAENGIEGAVDFTGKTNNGFIGTSLALFARKNRFYGDFRGTISEYGDYRVPADSIDIYSYRADISNNFLRNTAGKERNLHLSLGYIDERFQNRIFISNINSESGFFANAHGLEPRSVDKELHDKSNRDINNPYQAYNHFKITNSLTLKQKNGKRKFDVDLGFQNNFREEFSDYVDHGNMPATFPDSLSFPATLERQFDKNIFLGGIKGNFLIDNKTTLNVGLNGEFHENDIDGRGFIIPAYEQMNLGAFVFAKMDVGPLSLLQFGIRYDFGNIETESYTDWYSSPIESEGGIEEVYLSRAVELERTFSNFSWSIGYNYHPD
jgi:iron complex outermembrane receptor protein